MNEERKIRALNIRKVSRHKKKQKRKIEHDEREEQ
jgi:hypothetical protein